LGPNPLATGSSRSPHDMGLYTFYQDVGTSLYGNGVGGFRAAKIS